jgi:hypothetical protein
MISQRQDASHYVPVLRFKRAERVALRNLEESDKDSMTPLIEILPNGDARYEASGGSTIAAQVKENWGDRPLFIDFCQPSLPGVAELAISLSVAAQAYGLTTIPVTGLGRSDAYQRTIANVVGSNNHGLCMRVASRDLREATFTQRFISLISSLRVEPDAVDLIVDYGLGTAADPSFAYLCHRVPHPTAWRTFTVLGGSFPRDLTGFRIGEHEVPREEWLRWTHEIRNDRDRLSRLPSFGLCDSTSDLLRAARRGERKCKHSVYEQYLLGNHAR